MNQMWELGAKRLGSKSGIYYDMWCGHAGFTPLSYISSEESASSHSSVEILPLLALLLGVAAQIYQ